MEQGLPVLCQFRILRRGYIAP